MAEIEVLPMVTYLGHRPDGATTIKVDDQDDMVKAYLANGYLAKVTAGRKKKAADPADVGDSGNPPQQGEIVTDQTP